MISWVKDGKPKNTGPGLALTSEYLDPAAVMGSNVPSFIAIDICGEDLGSQCS
jgi:hypothetical protein